jgi:hypothetical protein
MSTGLLAAMGQVVISSDDANEPEIKVDLLTKDMSLMEECNLEAIPTILTFGAVLPGQSRIQGLEIGNTGIQDCQIQDVSFTAMSNSDFSLDNAAILGTLMSWEAKSVPVTYQPTGSGTARGTIEIVVANPNVATVSIPVTGVSDSVGLCVQPRHVAFGDTQTAATQSFQIYACGTRAITVTALDWTTADSEMRIANPPTLPFTLNSGERQDISVQYTPTDNAGDTGIITIRSSDTLSPNIDVTVTGGREIVPASAGRYLYYWQITMEGDIVRMPLQGNLQSEPYWGPRTGKPCAGCHNLSPDGRYLAMSILGNVAAMNPGLTIVDTETNQTALTPNGVSDAMYMAWNPDVETNPPYQYVYSEFGDLHLASLYAGYIGPLQGANDPNIDESMPAWGPNGQIAFVKASNAQAGGIGFGGPVDLFLIPEAGGTPQALVGASGNSGANYYPAFSPNGEWIAYTYSASALGTISALDAQLRLVRADNSGQMQLLTQANGNDGASSYPTWAKDGSHLSFSSNRQGGQGSWDLYIAPIDPTTGLDGPAVNIREANTVYFEHAAQWSP